MSGGQRSLLKKKLQV
ncbi:hypothetical protein QTP86_007964 [Hemibagrus guttatus]|nr:hypothetical protein QTP86_007964 [Hemibagrus guttatus]